MTNCKKEIFILNSTTKYGFSNEECECAFNLLKKAFQTKFTLECESTIEDMISNYTLMYTVNFKTKNSLSERIKDKLTFFKYKEKLHFKNIYTNECIVLNGLGKIVEWDI